MQKITPFLWFDNNAEEAIKFYTSIFKNSRILETSRYGEGSPFPVGTLLTASFQLEGQRFMALNGGPMYKFSEAVSLFVNVETQEELDDLWNKLLAGGTQQRCGWLKDKYGLSWQIIPSALGKYMGDKDPVKAGRVMQAMLKMDKIIIKDLEKAYHG
ncbi:MAG TPA: VOC family protein [Oligoflexus sp.]|uniref:VOC family protein n=1 Tax=Oligoflexus sp. TaxID=1971216 RepID=UPI002D50A056|nr:VOC family protein [Oligoflexus sp.]HYX34606.1 VOC family protein [Oligoflexus sp.]